MLTDSSILLTGGTGSFGHAFVPMTLSKYNPKRLAILSRDGMNRIGEAQRVPSGFNYCSDTNNEWMTREQLGEWIDANRAKIGKGIIK